MVKRFGKRFLNKKASLLDLFFVSGVVLFFVIFALISFKVVSEWDDGVQDLDIFPSTSKDASTEIKSFYSGVIDNTFLFFVLGMGIGTLILAAMVRVHPIFMIPAILVYALLIFFGGVVANIYHEFASTTELIAQANQLTFISNIMTYFPVVIGVFGALLMIVMYKQWEIAQ